MTDADHEVTEASEAVQERASLSLRQRVARSIPRAASGRFLKAHDGPSRRERKRSGNGPVPGATPSRRSKVSNGWSLFLNGGPQTSSEARRFADVLSAIVGDLGGPDSLSEGERQLARRCAAISLSCELLEARLVGAPEAVEERLKQFAGGLSPHQILGECSRLLHAVARAKAPGVAALASLPPVEQDRVVDLLTRAADISAKAIQAGSERNGDLELLGCLSDRLGRTFQRLFGGLRRRPRDLGVVENTAQQQQPEVWSPLRASLAEEERTSVRTEALNGEERTSERSEVLNGEEAAEPIEAEVDQ